MRIYEELSAFKYSSLYCYNTTFYPGCNLPVLVMELMYISLHKCIKVLQCLQGYNSVWAVISPLPLTFCTTEILCIEIFVGTIFSWITLKIFQLPKFLTLEYLVSLWNQNSYHVHSLTALEHRPGYLPPEAVRIDPTDYDSSLDIFMFGVVMTQADCKQRSYSWLIPSASKVSFPAGSALARTFHL